MQFTLQRGVVEPNFRIDLRAGIAIKYAPLLPVRRVRPAAVDAIGLERSDPPLRNQFGDHLLREVTVHAMHTDILRKALRIGIAHIAARHSSSEEPVDCTIGATRIALTVRKDECRNIDVVNLVPTASLPMRGRREVERDKILSVQSACQARDAAAFKARLHERAAFAWSSKFIAPGPFEPGQPDRSVAVGSAPDTGRGVFPKRFDLPAGITGIRPADGFNKAILLAFDGLQADQLFAGIEIIDPAFIAAAKARVDRLVAHRALPNAAQALGFLCYRRTGKYCGSEREHASRADHASSPSIARAIFMSRMERPFASCVVSSICTLL